MAHLNFTKELTTKIIESILPYQPGKIIMFGSLAINGTGNDIDLLIIKEDSEDSLIERELKIRKLLRGLHMPFDIFVLTPKELKNLYFRGSPFIKSILKEGKLIYMRDITKTWFKDAYEEYMDAKILFSSRRYRGTCIHSQQAVEKTLKALLLERGIEIPKVHDIKFLLEKVLESGWDIELNFDDADFLTSIYKGRYPAEEGLLPYGEPEEEDAKKALNIAEFIWQYAVKELGYSLTT